jgi:hypothetical protein
VAHDDTCICFEACTLGPQSKSPPSRGRRTSRADRFQFSSPREPDGWLALSTTFLLAFLWGRVAQNK